MTTARRILITGASGGIGQALARALAPAGFALTLHYRRHGEVAERLAAELGTPERPVCTLGFDVTDRAQTRTVLEADVAAHGAYWGVVLNAGISADAAFPALDEAAWDSVIATHLDGFYNVLAPLVMPLVRLRDGGRIVAMASTAGQIGNRGQVNYSAAKAGLIGASKALAMELASRHITVNCVAPGLIDTAMTETAPRETILKHVPMGRMGTPAEVAALVAFLMSDAAGYITRQVLAVNGGLC